MHERILSTRMKISLFVSVGYSHSSSGYTRSRTLFRYGSRVFAIKQTDLRDVATFRFVPIFCSLSFYTEMSQHFATSPHSSQTSSEFKVSFWKESPCSSSHIRRTNSCRQARDVKKREFFHSANCF